MCSEVAEEVEGDLFEEPDSDPGNEMDEVLFLLLVLGECNGDEQAEDKTEGDIDLRRLFMMVEAVEDPKPEEDFDDEVETEITLFGMVCSLV